MANCHTIIGAKRFHFRVRDGIGWFTLAMVTKQFGLVGIYLPTVIYRRVFLPAVWKSVTLFVLLVFVLKFSDFLGFRLIMS